MARFIKLTDFKSEKPFALNLDTVEYIRPATGFEGTEIVTVTHHTKYLVKEAMEDILFRAGMGDTAVDYEIPWPDDFLPLSAIETDTEVTTE